jgi:hypothetical protein
LFRFFLSFNIWSMVVDMIMSCQRILLVGWSSWWIHSELWVLEKSNKWFVKEWWELVFENFVDL